MIVSIHQPAYLPWLGYFHRIAKSDLHITLDHVQFEKNSFTNRNKVRTAGGWLWLTVPVKTKGRFGELRINHLEIDQANRWREKHWRTIVQAYSKAPYWKMHEEFFESTYVREWTLLYELCAHMTGYFLKVLGIRTPLMSSSIMNPAGTKSELVLDLCRQTKADTYYSGALGRAYLNEELFRKKAIRVSYQDYHHPKYVQFGQKHFEPYMGIIDLLLNCGPNSLMILMNGQEAPI